MYLTTSLTYESDMHTQAVVIVVIKHSPHIFFQSLFSGVRRRGKPPFKRRVKENVISFSTPRSHLLLSYPPVLFFVNHQHFPNQPSSLDNYFNVSITFSAWFSQTSFIPCIFLTHPQTFLAIPGQKAVHGRFFQITG